MTALNVQPNERPYCASTDCVELAEWHVKFEDGYETMECQAHFRSYLHPDFTKIDFHKIGQFCGLAGSMWRDSTIKVGDGECIINFGGTVDELLSKQLATA